MAGLFLKTSGGLVNVGGVISTNLHDDLTDVSSDQHHAQLHLLDTHSDVDLSGVANGQLLSWDSGQGRWVPVDAPAGAGTYVKVAGDTMTGPLIVDGASPQFVATGSGAFLETNSDGWVGWVSADDSGNRRWAFESDPGFGGLAGRLFLLKIYDALGANDQQIFRATIDKMRFDVPLEMGGNKIYDMATPTVAADAATKGYVDGAAVLSPDVRHMTQVTQAEYDALTPDADTLYIVVG